MMKKKIVFGLTLLGFSLSACSSLPARDTEYLGSTSAPTLKLPHDLSAHKVTEYYVVPDRQTLKRRPKTVPMLPPESLAAKQAQQRLKPLPKAVHASPKQAAVKRQHPDVVIKEPVLKVWEDLLSGLPDVGYNILRQDNAHYRLYFTTQPGGDAKLYDLHLVKMTEHNTAIWLYSGGEAVSNHESHAIVERLGEALQ